MVRNNSVDYEIVGRLGGRSVYLSGQIVDFHNRIFDQIDLVQERRNECEMNRRTMHIEVNNQTNKLYRILDLNELYW